MTTQLVHLQPHEVQERKTELGSVVAELQQARHNHSEAALEWKDKSKGLLSTVSFLERRMFDLSDAVRTGQEWRDTQEGLPLFPDEAPAHGGITSVSFEAGGRTVTATPAQVKDALKKVKATRGKRKASTEETEAP